MNQTGREMKLCTPEIVWHDKDPIYSVDFHHESGSEWRLASGGTDKHVKVSRGCPVWMHPVYLSSVVQHAGKVVIGRHKLS